MNQLAKELPLIVVYDFDESLYSTDTDSIAISFLKDTSLSELREQFPGQWNLMMQHVLSRVHAEGKTPDDFTNAYKHYPITNGLKNAVKTWAAAGVPQFIVSDANSMFIRLALEAHGLSEYFPQHHVYTNHVSYHSEKGYSMTFHHQNTWNNTSPPNMCKAVAISHLYSRLVNPLTVVLKDGVSNALSDATVLPITENDVFPCMHNTSPDESDAEIRYSGVTLYWGDGIGDVNGTLMLKQHDFIACRNQYACHRELTRIATEGDLAETVRGAWRKSWPLCGSMCPWESEQSVVNICASVATQVGYNVTFVEQTAVANENVIEVIQVRS